MSAGGPAFFPAYRPRPSALHAARAGVSAACCAALGLVFLLFEHPLVLAGGIAAVALAGARARVGFEMRRAAGLGMTIALLIAAINPLVSNGGQTLLVRGWAVLGHRFDITLEAVVYGAVAGLRVLGLVLVCALFSAVVDPDRLVRALRRVSYRSALTIALAMRLVPLLARDASRRSEGARCRTRPARRTALARAALAGSLERAVEVAAALEVRGYASARRGGRVRGRPGGAPARRARRRPLSRHDLSVGLAAAALAVVAVAAKAAGLGPFSAYPELEAPLDGAELALAAGIGALAAAPLAGHRARLGVRRTAAATGEVARA